MAANPPLSDLGLRADSMELLRRRPTHQVARVRSGRQTYIVKWYAEPAAEPLTYALLTRLSVPTAHVHRWTPTALLLEDLAARPGWRAADADDLATAEFGRQVADWYRHLHDSPAAAPHLRVEYEAINGAWVADLGRRLDTARTTTWRRLETQAEPLVHAHACLPKTLLYNDFHVSNVAVGASTATLFDFDAMALGTRASDCRNVASSLRRDALTAFHDSYGRLDPVAVALDAPLAVIAALDLASRRTTLPRWAAPLLTEVYDGTLGRKLDRATEALR